MLSKNKNKNHGKHICFTRLHFVDSSRTVEAPLIPFLINKKTKQESTFNFCFHFRFLKRKAIMVQSNTDHIVCFFLDKDNSSIPLLEIHKSIERKNKSGVQT